MLRLDGETRQRTILISLRMFRCERARDIPEVIVYGMETYIPLISSHVKRSGPITFVVVLSEMERQLTKGALSFQLKAVILFTCLPSITKKSILLYKIYTKYQSCQFRFPRKFLTSREKYLSFASSTFHVS